jgi:cbb3-type cytochrome oxidase maturation protein
VDVIYGLIPSMIFIGLVLVVVLFWAIKSGQFDDLEGDAQRILMDEDLIPENSGNSEKSTQTENNTENMQNKADKTINNS